MNKENTSRVLKALNLVLSSLQPLSPQERARVVSSVVTFFDISHVAVNFGDHSHTNRIELPANNSLDFIRNSSAEETTTFSVDRSPNPKAFLSGKQPRTDVERIAVLAYYLTHYRQTPHFKTLELSKLNTEAAQPKFTNAAHASNNAVASGYLVPAQKGFRQVSAAGERFVEALPDRGAAKDALLQLRSRRIKRRVPK